MGCDKLDEQGTVGVDSTDSIYPKNLRTIIDLLSSLPEEERREALISYAEQASKWEPKPDETFVLEDVRKDEECTDTVGVFLHVDSEQKVRFKVTLGPQVQTLTRAMTSILCRGLQDATPQEILDVPSDFVTKMIGADLVRVRSQTVYYVLTRMKGIVKVFVNRQRL
jgi:cysteine desulfuration protein SufE